MSAFRGKADIRSATDLSILILLNAPIIRTINTIPMISMKTIMRLMLVVAVSTAALCFNVPLSRAFEHGPWCAVVNLGDGNRYWDCQYNSLEECVPNVL